MEELGTTCALGTVWGKGTELPCLLLMCHCPRISVCSPTWNTSSASCPLGFAWGLTRFQGTGQAPPVSLRDPGIVPWPVSSGADIEPHGVAWSGHTVPACFCLRTFQCFAWNAVPPFWWLARFHLPSKVLDSRFPMRSLVWISPPCASSPLSSLWFGFQLHSRVIIVDFLVCLPPEVGDHWLLKKELLLVKHYPSIFPSDPRHPCKVGPDRRGLQVKKQTLSYFFDTSTLTYSLIWHIFIDLH